MNERLKTFLTGLCEAGLVVTLVFSIATAFNEWHQYLELFSHFRMQYFVVSVLLTLVFAFLKWRNYILLGLATVAFNAWFIVPWYLPTEAPDPSDADVRLLHANVLATNTDTERLLALVEDVDPDLLVLQEFTSDWLAALEPLASSYPYRVVEPRENDSFGIALYSKYPLDATTVIGSFPLGYPDIVATALVGGERLNIISTHPMQPLGTTNYGNRNLQLDSVADLARRSPRPIIVVGDLNITMWAHHYQRFEEVSGLSNARRGFGIAPTWPVWLYPGIIPIDHVLVSEDVVVTDFDTGPNIGSDHLPIIVRFTFAEETDE